MLPSHEQMAYFLTHPNDAEAERSIRGTSKEEYTPGSALADLMRRSNPELKGLPDHEVLYGRH
jgi:hypothetical protein